MTRTNQKAHSILLINFTEEEAKALRKAGFNVELGYIGSVTRDPASHKHLVPVFFPRPIYEFEALIYTSDYKRKGVSDIYSSSAKLVGLSDNALTPLTSYRTLPGFRLAFIGISAGIPGLLFAGLPFINLSPAHEGVSSFVVAKKDQTFSIPELTKIVGSFEKHIAMPIGQYAKWGEERTYPINHIPVILNRNGDQIAAYGTVYEGRTLPIYTILPQLKNNATAATQIMELVARLCPELFPDREIRDWYTSDEFVFKEEKDLEQEMSIRVQDTKAFLEEKRNEKAEVAARLEFIKKILIAREDPGLAADDRLSTNIKLVLEFLGFQVEDIDAKIKGVIKKEDFWVKEGDFIAITEITGTNAKNPKTKEFNDLLGRMTTIFKRRDLVPDASMISGLLIINYDIDTHPRKRPKLYGGDAEEIVEAAKEQNIGLFSTVDLYDIAVAVKDGLMGKEQARAMIRGFGRIEFKSKL